MNKWMGALSVLALAGSAYAAGQFAVSTDRLAYTGSVTRYATLADAQAGTNAIGTYAIPNRATAAPYDTGSRDAAFYFIKDMAEVDTDANILMTAWWYTTTDNTNGKAKDDPAGNRYYSGYGNSNKTNTGFLQLYDADASTETSADGSFGDWDGAYFTSYTLQVSGQSAGQADTARLWAAPYAGGASVITAGVFHNYSLNVTFGGLQGQANGGVIEATDHPDSATGSFTALFENKNYDWYPTNPSASIQHQGFYVVDYTFNLDNWAFGVGDAALNGDFSPSYFAAVPEPASLSLLVIGSALAIRRRR